METSEKETFEVAFLTPADEAAELAQANEQFNKGLQMQIAGTLPKSYIYQMGMPCALLRSVDFPYSRIELRAEKLDEKSGDTNKHHHPFDIQEVHNLPFAIQSPMAIFAYGDKSKAVNLITDLEQNGIKFLVGIAMHPVVDGKILEINSIRNVFPRNANEWVLWIQQEKHLYLNKEKVKIQIEQQRRTLTDLPYLDLITVAKVINSFENPKLFCKKIVKRIGKVELSMEQRQNLAAGKVVRIENATTQSGKTYAEVYARWNAEAQQLRVSQQKPAEKVVLKAPTPAKRRGGCRQNQHSTNILRLYCKIRKRRFCSRNANN